MLTVDYDRLDLSAGERLLDLGCGFGRHSYEALKRGAEVVACDLARPEVSRYATWPGCWWPKARSTSR